jgi:hypothetical protein
MCQLDSGVYPAFSIDCNSLNPEMLPVWQKASHVHFSVQTPMPESTNGIL